MSVNIVHQFSSPMTQVNTLRIVEVAEPTKYGPFTLPANTFLFHISGVNKENESRGTYLILEPENDALRQWNVSALRSQHSSHVLNFIKNAPQSTYQYDRVTENPGGTFMVNPIVMMTLLTRIQNIVNIALAPQIEVL